MIVERTPLSESLPFDITALIAHCRTDGIGEADPELSRMGTAAAAELEAYAGLALLDQTVKVTMEGWPRSAWLHLPVAPLLDSLSVSVAADGAPFDGFAVATGLRPALRLSDARPCGLIVVQYVAGFGEALHDLPADLALAIMDQTVTAFDGRGIVDGKSNCMSPHMARIAARYRRVAL